jgi:hypothetical protein
LACPKNKTLLGSVALSLRIHLAVGITLVGYEVYIAELLIRMGIKLTKGTAGHLNQIWKAKQAWSEKQKQLSHKRKRQDGKRSKLPRKITDTLERKGN